MMTNEGNRERYGESVDCRGDREERPEERPADTMPHVMMTSEGTERDKENVSTVEGREKKRH